MWRNPAVRRRDYSCNFAESDDNGYGREDGLTCYEWKRGRSRGFVFTIGKRARGWVQGEASAVKDSLLSAAPRRYPRVSMNLWHLAPLSPEYLHALPRHYEKYAECLRSCGTSNTCTSSILPGPSHLAFTPQKAATSDQGQKQKQLMSNADACVISSEQGGAIILEITRKVMTSVYP